MVIHKLRATFGCLEGGVLELKDGLNVINAPNESGKSTWCAFIRAMLYGVDSAERARSGHLPDKTHYAPWTGSPMSGSMELTHGGRDITLSRSTKSANAPMRVFSATYTGTADAVPGIDAANVGEYLTGASREVFCSSAFIGQGAAAVTGSAELERRIASVVSSGEEDVSALEADERLRAWLRRRRYNRRGAIPDLEREIAQSEDVLRRVSDTVAERERARAELARCSGEAERLSERLKSARESERESAREDFRRSGERVSELERVYAEAADAAAKAAADAAGGVFSGMSADEAVSLAETEAGQAQNYEWIAKQTKSLTPAVILSVLALAGILCGIFINGLIFILAAPFAALAVWKFASYSESRSAAAEAASNYNAVLAKYAVKSPEDITALAADYARRLAAAQEAAQRLEQARAALERARDVRRADEGRITGAQESDALRRTEWELASMNARRESLTARIAELSGAISAMGDPVAVESGIRERQERLETLTRQYDAIELAANTLEKAGALLQSRFSPALGKRAAEIFGRLTGGRYDELTVSRDFSVLVKRAGDTVQRGSLYLSAGAADLMYLAVRLAIAELALPSDEPCPIILDDALAYLDPVRRERVLELLDEIGKTRQVILFTCA